MRPESDAPSTGWLDDRRIRRLEFAALPKTMSGKARRVELHADPSAAPAGERTLAR